MHAMKEYTRGITQVLNLGRGEWSVLPPAALLYPLEDKVVSEPV